MGSVCCNGRRGEQTNVAQTERKKVRRRRGSSHRTINTPSIQGPRLSVLGKLSESRIQTPGKPDLETKGTTASTDFINTTLDFPIRDDPAPDNSLEFILPQISELREDLRDRVTELMEIDRHNFTEEPEETEGFLSAEVVLENERNQKRVIVVSSSALYILDPDTLRLDRKVKIAQIQLITLSSDMALCLLHRGTIDIAGDLMLESSEMEEFLTALEVLYNEQTRKYIPFITLDSCTAVKNKANKMAKAALMSFHTTEFEQITTVFVRKGEIGENRLFFRRAKWWTEGQREELGQVLLSTRALYLLQDDFTLKEKHSLDTIDGVTVSSTYDQVVIHSRKGERLLALNNSFVEALDKAFVKGGYPKLSVLSKSNFELSLKFRRTMEPRSALLPISRLL